MSRLRNFLLPLLFVVSTLCSIALLMPSTVRAWDPHIDRPEPGETFSHFFTRITRGGQFQGIRLEVPKRVEASFYPRIWRPTWEGRLDKVRALLSRQGADLWADWYHRPAPLAILVPTPAAQLELARALQKTETQDPACATACRDFQSLLASRWDDFNAHERQAFAKAMVFQARLFGGKRILDYLAAEHRGSPADAEAAVEVKFLANDEFVKTVRQAGWDGPIYFRGVTLPAPGDASRHWIIIDDNLMRKMTPFDSPLLRSLEYVGVLTHEMSHVFQDQTARALGLDLSVTSPEDALLIEGDAEYLAERALSNAGASQAYPSAVSLFSAEQGVEIVNRPGQAEQGNLFPYTVGVPFVASLFDLEPSPAGQVRLQAEILRTLAGEQTLARMLKTLF